MKFLDPLYIQILNIFHYELHQIIG